MHRGKMSPVLFEIQSQVMRIELLPLQVLPLNVNGKDTSEIREEPK